MDKVKVIRSVRRRSIGIQIMPDASITISVPYFFPNSKIDKILKEKADWIREHQEKVKNRMQFFTERSRSAQDKPLYSYLGKSYPLEIRLNQKSIVELEDKFYIASSNKKFTQSY